MTPPVDPREVKTERRLNAAAALWFLSYVFLLPGILVLGLTSGRLTPDNSRAIGTGVTFAYCVLGVVLVVAYMRYGLRTGGYLRELRTWLAQTDDATLAHPPELPDIRGTKDALRRERARRERERLPTENNRSELS